MSNGRGTPLVMGGGMRKTLLAWTILPLTAGCVAENDVKPESLAVVAGYSCEDLQNKLTTMGVMRDKSSKDENRNSGGEVAGRIAVDVIFPVGKAMEFYNQKNAEGNTKRVKSALDVYYQAWDDKKCSQWLYEKNAAQAKNSVAK